MSTIWITMAVAGLLTFLIRFSFIGVLARWEPPKWIARSLRFVPPAVLSAIVFPEVLVQGSRLQPLSPRLAAAVVAAFVAWRLKSPVLAIVAGMAVLLGLQALGL